MLEVFKSLQAALTATRAESREEMKRRYITRVTRPDGSSYLEEFSKLEDAVKLANNISVCHGWSATVYTKCRREWIKII